MDSKQLQEKAQKIIKEFDKDAVIYLILLLCSIFFLFTKVVAPNFSELGKNFGQYTEKKDIASTMKRKYEHLQTLKNKQITKKTSLPIKIYKIQHNDLELENAASEFINEVIKKFKETGPSKILSLDFDKLPIKDALGIESKKHSILRLKIELESTYDIIQQILNEIYLMEHLVKVNNVTLSTLEKYQHRKIQVYMELDLFIDVS